VRNNGPVTNKNHPLSADDVLISKTDTESYITYANQRFIEISGFSYEELLHSPHNLVRHPDMPPVVFKDMWDTLKSGQSWSGLVKNRRKNGDHYWVQANVVPLRDGSIIKGFASIRAKPDEAEVAMAEKVYRDIREGGGNYVVHRGMWYPSGILGRIKRWNLYGVGARMGLQIGLVAVLVSAIAISTFGALSSQAALLLEIAGILCGSVVIILSWRLSRYLKSAFTEASDFTLQVAAGNLKAELPDRGRDEVGQMLRSLGFMRKSLGFLIGEVNERVSVVRPSVNELFDNNTAMAARIEQQASAIQETAATTEQISTTVSQNAQHSRQASEASVGNMQEVDAANQIMDSLGQSMQEIIAQAENMASIVGTIDSIAFQTNILALNASVEAARAGEHGRGFAVVAQEVRKLASQSADAAQQVQQLIEKARAGIGQGEKHTAKAQEAMGRIRQTSQQVTQLVEEINGATTEQDNGIRQISQAIGEIDKAIQESSAAMQTYNVSTESLRHEVLSLSHSAQAFLSEQEIMDRERILSHDRSEEAQLKAAKKNMDKILRRYTRTSI
jgi:aerotaxis receptor